MGCLLLPGERSDPFVLSPSQATGVPPSFHGKSDTGVFHPEAPVRLVHHTAEPLEAKLDLKSTATLIPTLALTLAGGTFQDGFKGQMMVEVLLVAPSLTSSVP